jgi:hypothetical protein
VGSLSNLCRINKPAGHFRTALALRWLAPGGASTAWNQRTARNRTKLGINTQVAVETQSSVRDSRPGAHDTPAAAPRPKASAPPGASELSISGCALHSPAAAVRIPDPARRGGIRHRSAMYMLSWDAGTCHCWPFCIDDNALKARLLPRVRAMRTVRVIAHHLHRRHTVYAPPGRWRPPRPAAAPGGAARRGCTFNTGASRSSGPHDADGSCHLAWPVAAASPRGGARRPLSRAPSRCRSTQRPARPGRTERDIF